MRNFLQRSLTVAALLVLAGGTLSAASGTVPAAYLASLPAGTSVNAVARDTNGNTLLAGQITPPGAAYTAGDAFVASIAADASLRYLTRLGGSSFDAAGAVAVDAAGNAYVAGQTSSVDFPTTPNAWQTKFDQSPENAQIGFVVKLGPSGSILYSTLINHAYGAAIAVNPNGEAIVTGYSNDKLATTPGAPDFGAAKGRFILRLSASGDRPIFSLLGPGGSAITLDGQGNIYTAGSGFDQGDIPTTPGAYQQHVPSSGCGGGIQFRIPCSHQYVCKVDAAGSKLAFCTYLSGTSADIVGGIAVDSKGDIYLAGATYSADYPITAGAAQPHNVSTQPPFPVNPPVYPSLYEFFPRHRVFL